MAQSFHEPSVCIEIGVKWVLESSVYLAVLLEAARSAVGASLVGVSLTYEMEYVSATVISHASGLPLLQDMRVAPSGLLPSDREGPTGSFTDEYCYLFTDFQLLSFLFSMAYESRLTLIAEKSTQTRFVDHCSANPGVCLTCCTSKTVANSYADLDRSFDNLKAVVGGA